MTPILEVQQLSKIYGAHKAVDNLSFAVAPGEVYGFLGENGAGKSTTLRCALGLIRPTAGKIFIKGQPFPKTDRRLLRQVGAVVERPDMYNYLSGRENLRLFADLCDPKIPNARIAEVVELVGLKGRDGDRVSAYSLGMKQRLGIAIALVHDPELLILDEPTNGLDPQGIADIRNLIRHLCADRGKTVIVSSHLLHEVEQMATRLLIMHKGKKMAEGGMSDLLRPADTRVTITTDVLLPAVQESLKTDGWSPFLESAAAGELHYRLHPDKIPNLNAHLVGAGIGVHSIQTRHSLEALFLQLTAS